MIIKKIFRKITLFFICKIELNEVQSNNNKSVFSKYRLFTVYSLHSQKKLFLRQFLF